MELLQFVMVAFGITAILNKGSIFEGLRRTWLEKLKGFKPWKSLHTFFFCPLCIGFWAGIVVSVFWKSPTGNIFFDGCLASGASWFIMMVEYYLTKSTGGCKGCGGH
jgi:hypothetical protein